MIKEKKQSVSTPFTALTMTLIFLIGIGVSWMIFSTEPTAQKEGATRKSPMLVKTESINLEDHTPVIEVMGTVIPSRNIMLQAKVSGEVVELSEKFLPGQFLEKGEFILQQDQQDHQIQWLESQSDLHEAQAQLQIELGEQMAAQQDYNRLGRKLSEPQRSLVLREPQLEIAKAQVEAAEAAMKQAQLNLDRTRIVSPFDAQIQTIHVNLGSQVNGGDELVNFIGTEQFWVEATLPGNLLSSISLEPSSADVQLQDTLTWNKNQFRQGKILSTLSKLDETTRMVRILIGVDDPLGLKDKQLPALIPGSFIRCLIPINKISNVAKIDRKYVRKNDTLWIMQDQLLKIVEPEVIFRDAHHIYVREGVKSGDELIISDISRVRSGAPLKRDSRL